MLVAKLDAVVDEVAHGLDAGPAGRRFAKEGPREIQQFVAVAVTASEQKDEGVVGNGLDAALGSVGDGGVGQAGVVEFCACRKCDFSGGRDKTNAPVAEGVAVGGRGNRRRGDDVVWRGQVGSARIVDIEHQDRRRRLWEAVTEFTSDLKFHGCADLLARAGRDGFWNGSTPRWCGAGLFAISLGVGRGFGC